MLILLGTEGCHLCEEAEAILAALLAENNGRFAIKMIDIAEQQQWQEKYACRIPLIYHPETESELGWPFDKQMLQTFLGTVSSELTPATQSLADD